MSPFNNQNKVFEYLNAIKSSLPAQAEWQFVNSFKLQTRLVSN